MRDELVCFKKAGGGTIVENTTTGISRDLLALRQLAKDTGVNIVAGAGYYVDATHSDETRKMTVEEVCVSVNSIGLISFTLATVRFNMTASISLSPESLPK